MHYRTEIPCGYLNKPPFAYVASNTNAISLSFLILRALVTLRHDPTSTTVNMYLHVFPSMTLRGA